ncbi:hypothetical protein C2R22_15340 [Salinigranum rubrum]|uniref:Uncharacterized protein n=1 Tax=Salinigranum rubrum TaxID=755307 RepID=A0A2I8VLN2_9EURY|nr:hypothetical protein [Salinigranum rubrum]AUV82840.1 hypothetical protein C2R22_15340 [Salinigranum rubrum]
MGTLALDIETASPFESPDPSDFDDTRYFELVAVALGYRPAPNADPELAVFLRRGGWAVEHTADLLVRAMEWCDDRESDRLLTYNGEGFDLVHLRNWVDEAAETGHSDLGERFDRLTARHLDLKRPATERYRDRLPGRASFHKLERVCRWEGIDVEETRYADYDLNPDFLRGVGVPERDAAVEGKHVGQGLGAAYVEGVAAGLDDRLTYRELDRLLRDYARSDVAALFELADALAV